MIDRTTHANRFRAHGRRPKDTNIYAVLHWCSVAAWDWSRGQPKPEGVEAVFKAYAPYRRGYNALALDGVAHEIVPWRHLVWHAGNSRALRHANTVSVGVAVPYPGPSFRPRGVDGEVELPWTDYSTGEQRTAFYPPIGAEAFEPLVAYLRQIRTEGAGLVEVYCHHHIDPKKNDLRNMDPQFGPPNTGLTYPEFRARVMA